jgi:Ankyrin repeat
VELLTKSGAAVDAPLVNGITALHVSAIVGDVDRIALLLKCGADKNLRDRTGQSAQELAQRCKHPAAAELLGTTTVTTYDTLKRIFSEQRPALTDAFLKDVLWILYRDPASTASLTLSYVDPSRYDVVAKFDKQADVITSTVRVTEHGDVHPMQTTETQHTLVDGAWQAKVVRNRQG